MGISNQIRIEHDLRPAYYDDFQCLAGECRLSCCKGWQISFDKKDYMALKAQTGSPAFNARMAHALHRTRSGLTYGEFRLKEEDGLCPLCCENGLCMLQLEKGHDALPFVCRTFPRGEGPRISGYWERSLSPACEAVLALLWDLPEGVDFRSDPLPPGSWTRISAERPSPLVPYFQEIRSQCIDFLQDRRVPLPQRILMIGLALKNFVDGETDLERWIAYTQLLSEQASTGAFALQEEEESSLSKFLLSNIQTLSRFPVSNDDFKDLRRDLLEAVGVRPKAGTQKVLFTTEPYREIRARFEACFAGREYFMENLMVTLFFRLGLPIVDSIADLWKSYVNLCNLYSICRFLAVMSCREGAAGDKAELFRLMVYASRKMIHSSQTTSKVRDEFFAHDSATLAHMAILLSG